MGVKAQSVDGKKSTCLLSARSNRLLAGLFMYSVSRYSIFILFARLLLITCSFLGKLFLLFMSIFTHLTQLQGKDTVRLFEDYFKSQNLLCGVQNSTGGPKIAPTAATERGERRTHRAGSGAELRHNIQSPQQNVSNTGTLKSIKSPFNNTLIIIIYHNV